MSIPSSSRNHSQDKTSDEIQSLSEAEDTDLEWHSTHQIFLSHSGAQKNFVEQLHKDLKAENMSSFFDKDPESLPKGREFPKRIFEAAASCKVAVVVLSKEFISSKWPMLELCAFVKAKNSNNPHIAILPLFFKMSVRELDQEMKDRSFYVEWEKIRGADNRIDLNEWLTALKTLKKFNGIEYIQAEGEVNYREKVVEHIRFLLPPILKYDDSHVVGRRRLCQEVANLFEKAPLRNGANVVGLYGMGGTGKSTLCMSLCNLFSRKFEGKVCHAQLESGKIVETQKDVLRILTGASEVLLNSVTGKEQGSQLLRQRMPKHKVFLTLDNIVDTPASKEEVELYLRAGFGEGSMVLLTARSIDILKTLLPEAESHLMHVPDLREEEALTMMLHSLKTVDLKPMELSNLTSQQKHVIERCIRQCFLGEDREEHGRYHPLALKAFSAYLCTNFGHDPSKWNEIPIFVDCIGVETIYSIFEQSCSSLKPKHFEIFMLITVYLPRKNLTFSESCEWIAAVSGERALNVSDVIHQLKLKALIEGFDEDHKPFRVHDLVIDFAENKGAELTGPSIFLRDADDVPIGLQRTFPNDFHGFKWIKFLNCRLQSLSSVNHNLFCNVTVLHLEGTKDIRMLDLRCMKILRSLVVNNGEGLEQVRGLEGLSKLTWLRLIDFDRIVKIPDLGGLRALRYLELQSHNIRELKGLSKCTALAKIQIKCRRFKDFPKTEGMKALQKAIFEGFQGVVPPNIMGFSKLEEISFISCARMSHPPKLNGCCNLKVLHMIGNMELREFPSLNGLTSLEKLWLNTSLTIKEAPKYLDSCSTLKMLKLWELKKLQILPSFSRLTSLRFLNLVSCDELSEPPDLSSCQLLETVEISYCKSLRAFPSLVGLSFLQKLLLATCERVTEPPHLSGCTHLADLVLYDNPNMKGFPWLNDATSLERLLLQWYVEKSEEDEGDVAVPSEIRQCPIFSGMDPTQYVRTQPSRQSPPHLQSFVLSIN